MREALDDVRRRRPDVFKRLVFHATGEPASSLEGIGGVVFWLADEARTRGLALINPPEVLSNSIKSEQAGLWRAAGISTPPVERFDDFAALKSTIERLPFPVLVRGDERHGQSGARVFSAGDAGRTA
jgi:hypothetical protein